MRFHVVISTVVLLFSVSSYSSDYSASGSTKQGAVNKLLNNIESIRRHYKVPAVGFSLVAKNSIIWSGAMGVTDIKTQHPVTAKTQFRIGSITKAFTGLAILALQQDHKLTLSDTIASWVPATLYSNPWANQHPIRIAHLLEHTAGFTDISSTEFANNDATPLTLLQGLTLSPQSRHTRWPPGQHSSYSNAGAGLAGLIIEQITQQRYEDFVQQHLLKPLAMKDSGFFPHPNLAQGYQADGKEPIPYWHMIFRPFGAINSTPSDMAAFVQLLLNEGVYNGERLFTQASIARMEKPTTTLAAQSGLEHGYGLGNYQWLHQGFRFHGHGGDGDGYLARFGYNRDSGLGYFVVVTVFNHQPLREMQRKIEDHIIRNLPTPAQPPQKKIGNKLEKYQGIYHPVTQRFASSPKHNDRLRVFLHNSTLHTQFNHRSSRKLIAVNDQHFRRSTDTVATIAFIEKNGQMYLQADFGNYQRVNKTTNP